MFNRILIILLLSILSIVNLFGQPFTIRDYFNSKQDTFFVVFETEEELQKDISEKLSNYLEQILSNKTIVKMNSSNNPLVPSEDFYERANIVLVGKLLPESLVWKSFALPHLISLRKFYKQLPDSGFIATIGVSPKGENKVLVLSGDLINFPNLLKNPINQESSYSFRIGQKEFKSGLLNDKLFPYNPPLDIFKSKEDFDYIFETMEDVHPNLLFRVSADEYLKLKKTLRDSIEYLHNHDQLYISNFLMLIKELVAKFGDGHTTVPVYNNTDKVMYHDPSKLLLPPFLLDYHLGKLRIVSTIPSLKYLINHELVLIDNKSPSEFFRKILNSISAEKETFKWSSLCNNQKNYFVMSPIFNDEILIKTKNDSSLIKNYTIKTIGLNNYLEVEEPKSIRKNSYFKYYNDNDIVYYQYNSFTDNSNEKEFIDSLFADVKRKYPNNFILDIRFNGGGSTVMLNYLLDYLTEKEYRIYSKYTTKISNQLIAHKKGYSKYQKLVGMIITKYNELKNPKNRGNKYHGKIYLLTSTDTFSSAADMAAVIKDYKVGTILGSETGGVRQAFGDILYFTSPNYGIKFNMSFKEFFAPIPNPDDEKRGTIPDIILNNQNLNKYQNSKDPELDYTLDFIKNK